MSLLSATELEQFLRSDKMNPFIVEDGKVVDLKPPEQRMSFVSNNANHPLFGQQARGIIQAYAVVNPETGAPTVGGIANSYNSCTKGGSIDSIDGIVSGARMSYLMISDWAKAYNVRGLAFLFDHYTGPTFDPNKTYKPSPQSTFTRAEALKAISEAIEFLNNQQIELETECGSVAPADLAKIDKETIEAYADYLLSEEYTEFRLKCKGVAKVAKAARHMVELGENPVVLNFAASKDMVKALKQEVPAEGGPSDIRIELSLIDTPQEDIPYEYLDNDVPKAQKYGKLAVAFLEFTGGDTLSYPIGMEHAVPIGKPKRRPDITKLYWVQKTLYEHFGHIVPFACHGGTSLYNWTDPKHDEIFYGNVAKYINVDALVADLDDNTAQITRDLIAGKLKHGEATNPEEWRGLITQVNINTNYLAAYAVSALEFALAPKNFASIIQRSKKSGGMANEQIKAIREAVLYPAKIVNAFGNSPFGGGIDVTKLKDGYLVTGTDTAKFDKE